MSDADAARRPLYPMLLDVSERLVVIIGAGNVAARKASGVIEAGAVHVRVVAPEFRAAFPSNVEGVMETYRPAHLDGAGLIFAATDNLSINDAVVRDARERGVMCCRADSDVDLPGDFVTPAQLVRGPVHVTVSAGSAALAALLRDLIGEAWEENWTRMAEVMAEIRPKIVNDRRLSAENRRNVLRTLATREALDILRSRGRDGLVNWLTSCHPEVHVTSS